MPREIGPAEVTCLKCGWVSYAVTREEALQRVADFNAWRDGLDPERRRHYPHSTTLERYRCLGCGGTGPYRPAEAEDCPDGATVCAVIWPLE